MENNITVSNLFKDISQLIDSARVRVAHYANSSLVLLYWQIGSIVQSEILKEDRAEYGLMIVKHYLFCLHLVMVEGLVGALYLEWYVF